MRILGLDLSLTSTGVCVLEKDKHQTLTITTTPKDKKLRRMNQILQKVMARILESNSPVSNVVIEGFAFQTRKTSSLVDLAGLAYLVRYFLWHHTYLPVLIVPPTVLKKFVLGKGNAPKQQMLLGAYKKYGQEFENDDECDAYCLAQLGWMYWNNQTKTFMKEVGQKCEMQERKYHVLSQPGDVDRPARP